MDVKRPRRGPIIMARLFLFLFSIALSLCQITGILQFDEFFWALSIVISILGALSMVQIDKQKKEILSLKKDLSNLKKKLKKLETNNKVILKRYHELMSDNEVIQRQLNRSKIKKRKRTEKKYLLETENSRQSDSDDE